MQCKIPVASQLGGVLHPGQCLHLAIVGVLETEQSRPGEMRVVGLDDGVDVVQVERTIVEHSHRLGLDAAEHRSAAGLVPVAVRMVAHDVLVAAAAVGEQRAQIALRTARDEDGRLLAQ